MIQDNSVDTALKAAYVNQRFGALVCWGMPTFDSEGVFTDVPVDTFAPTGLDVGQWLDACVAAGMTYACLTTKHHHGFALWPTAYHVAGYAPYSIASTAWYAANGSPDVVGLFVAGCRSRGLAPCLYFSAFDKVYELRGGRDVYLDTAAYLTMIETQLSELLTNYGTIPAIWLDAFGWKLSYTYIQYATIYNYIKGLSPNTLVIENNHRFDLQTSEILEFEAHPIPDGNLYPAEYVSTVRSDGKWFYHAADAQTVAALRTSATIKGEITATASRHGTTLLGITPGTNGALPAAQVSLLAAIP